MELDSRVLLNLKCEELWEIGTPIMAQTKVIFKFRELSEGVEFNSLSNAHKFEFMALFIVPVSTLNRCKNVSKKM